MGLGFVYPLSYFNRTLTVCGSLSSPPSTGLRYVVRPRAVMLPQVPPSVRVKIPRPGVMPAEA